MPIGFARRIHCGQADQIGVIIFAFLERRQRRRGRPRPAIRAAPRQQSDRRPLRTAQPPSCRCRERQGGAFSAPPTKQLLLARQALDAVAEQLEPHLAFDAMRAGNGGKRNFTLAAAHRYAWVSSAAPSAGSSLDSPSAATSALLGEPSVAGAISSEPSAGASAEFAGLGFAGCFLGNLLRRPALALQQRLPPPPASATGASSQPQLLQRLLRRRAPRRARRRCRQAPARRQLASTSAAGSSAGALAAASASAAFFARSSRRSLAFSPGSAFFGLLRAGRSFRPAASRKRRTRSDGWAPTLSQWLMRSVSSFTRSGRILRQQRVVGADLLDEAAVTSVAAVGHDDPVIRPLLGAAAGETNCNCHYNFLS